jgi:hypothetical protein
MLGPFLHMTLGCAQAPTQRVLQSFRLWVFSTHLTPNPPNSKLANTHRPDLRSTLLSQPMTEIYFRTSDVQDFECSKHLFPLKCSIPRVTDRVPCVFPINGRYPSFARFGRLAVNAPPRSFFWSTNPPK